MSDLSQEPVSLSSCPFDVAEFPFARDGDPLDLPSRYTYLRKNEPVSPVRIWSGQLAWLISGYEDGRNVLKMSEAVSSDSTHPNHPHQGPGTYVQRSRRSFIGMDPPEHSYYRQMVMGEFTVGRVESLRPAITEIVTRHLAVMERLGQPADLVEHFAQPIPSSAIAALLGVPYEDHEFFEKNSKFFTSADTSVAETSTAAQLLCDYLDRQIRLKRENPSNDLLSRLGAKVGERLLSEEAAVNIALLLLFGGHDTTANQISLSVLALMRNPDQLALLRSNPDLIKSAVEELLRFVGATQSGRRRVAVEDFEVAGQLIRTGDPIIVANDSGNRDETAFDDPDVLKLDRDGAVHVAFGDGIHQCLGQRVARVDLQIALEELWKRLPNVRLAIPFEELSFKSAGIVYGVHSLPVEW